LQTTSESRERKQEEMKKEASKSNEESKEDKNTPEGKEEGEKNEEKKKDETQEDQEEKKGLQRTESDMHQEVLLPWSKVQPNVKYKKRKATIYRK
jgi:hypothetical protein